LVPVFREDPPEPDVPSDVVARDLLDRDAHSRSLQHLSDYLAEALSRQSTGEVLAGWRSFEMS
jgi:hypothetical protein